MANSVSDLATALVATDVHYRIKDKKILDGAFLSVDPGTITVLLGPNGAGKTTLLSILQGLTKPERGDISLLGEQPFKGSAQLRSRVGVMLQDGGLPQSVTADRLLNHVAGFYPDHINVSELKSRLGINEFDRTNIRNLSGGQKQRVALAAALIGKPEFVFLDEPSAGLDPQSRQQVFDFILSLRDAGMTILLTTHLLSEADKLADYVYLLKDGKTVAHGTVADLTQSGNGIGKDSSAQPLLLRPATPLTEAQLRLLESAVPHGQIHVESGSTKDTAYLIEGCSTSQDLAAVTHAMAKANVVPVELHFRPRTLEDVFFEVASESQETVS